MKNTFDDLSDRPAASATRDTPPAHQMALRAESIDGLSSAHVDDVA
jgi:hypothetical protein